MTRPRVSIRLLMGVAAVAAFDLALVRALNGNPWVDGGLAAACVLPMVVVGPAFLGWPRLFGRRPGPFRSGWAAGAIAAALLTAWGLVDQPMYRTWTDPATGAIRMERVSEGGMAGAAFGAYDGWTERQCARAGLDTANLSMPARVAAILLITFVPQAAFGLMTGLLAWGVARAAAGRSGRGGAWPVIAG